MNIKEVPCGKFGQLFVPGFVVSPRGTSNVDISAAVACRCIHSVYSSIIEINLRIFQRFYSIFRGEFKE